MAQNDKKEVKYPIIVSTAPCNDDWFEGKSHKRIASKIADIILDNSQHGIIGIDGGWGSGKSNLVGMTQKEIAYRTEGDKDNKYVFVTFDAWAHHTDYLRRSLLEEFVNELTVEKNLLSSKWNDSLDMVLARVKEVDMKQTVKLNEFVIGAGILAFVTPIISLFFDKPAFYYVMGAVYVFLILGTVFSIIVSMKRFGQKVTFANFWADIRNLYVDAANIFTRQGYSEVNNKSKQTKTREIITEKEPTARQFRNWMSQIDKELESKKTHVVFVIDNMDRLPIAKVKETWATIHAFFAECKYNYIHTVIPFDRSHIINAFKEENIKVGDAKTDKKGEDKTEQQTELKSYGNDFINKTFYVVYRVSPPILSDWRDYFERVWKMAFGNEIYKEHDELLLVFEKLSADFTPRSIIAFINECVTLYSVMEDEIPSEYLGIYILGKERINKAPDRQLLNPDFLEGLKGKYEKDDELPRYLSAIHYQIKKDRAMDVVYLPKVKKALDDGDVKFVEEMGNDRVMNALLPDAIANTNNIDNAIRFMEAVSKKQNGVANNRLDYLWKELFIRVKVVGYNAPNYDSHHAVLLEHSKDKKGVVDFFIGRYLKMGENWSVTKFVEGMKRFRELAKNETDKYLNDFPVTAKDEIIEELLMQEKENYADYGLKMNTDSFDKYLAEKDVAKFGDVDYLPIIFGEQCKLDNTWAALQALATDTDDIGEHSILLKRMKEINWENRMMEVFENTYTDSKIYKLYQSLSGEDELMADVVAMRIARGTKFSPSVTVTKTAFQNELSSEDDTFVKRVADEVLYYMNYGKFIVSIVDFEQTQLVSAIVRELTLNETKLVKEIPLKDQVLLYYEGIVNTSGIEPKTLLEQIQVCEGDVEYRDFNKWPMSLFSACKELDMDVAKSINQHSHDYLREVSTDRWAEQLMKPGFELNLWKVYKDDLFNQKDAAINVLMKYATEGTHKPDKSLLTEVLSVYGKEKYKLKEAFSGIYDVIVKNANKDNVAYFTSWLFEYNVISNGNHISDLYKTGLLDDSNVIAELIKVGDKLNGIKLPEDFVSKMAQMATGNRKGESVFVELCQKNGQINAVMEEIIHPKEKEKGE